MPVLFGEAPFIDRAWSGDHITLGALRGTLLFQLGDCSRIMTYSDAIPPSVPPGGSILCHEYRFH